ncbi:MAG: hypothetical protein R3C03_04650 [Pirellulaceae bacterium]
MKVQNRKMARRMPYFAACWLLNVTSRKVLMGLGSNNEGAMQALRPRQIESCDVILKH